MATRIRLQRHGKKGKAFFHIVAADSRAKRDGKFIEKLGTYNPVSNPATIDINFERTLHWVTVGAEMSDTARAILSYKGVLFKSHLLKGVEKGAFTLEVAEKKFNVWQLEKENKKLSVQVDSLTLLVPSEENIKLSNLKSRYSVYDELNNEMSKLNRQEQMLKFQNTFIIPQKEDLRKQISILENN